MRRDARVLPEGVIPMSADLGDRASLVLPAEIDRLVYAVAPGGATDERYRAAYVTGLENVRDALLRSGAEIKRAILTTSTAVYAQDDGSWVDEDSAVSATGTAAYLLEGERVVRDGFARGISLRLSGIYGPGRDRLVRAVAEQSARRPREPRWTSTPRRQRSTTSKSCAGGWVIQAWT